MYNCKHTNTCNKLHIYKFAHRFISINPTPDSICMFVFIYMYIYTYIHTNIFLKLNKELYLKIHVKIPLYL